MWIVNIVITNGGSESSMKGFTFLFTKYFKNKISAQKCYRQNLEEEYSNMYEETKKQIKRKSDIQLYTLTSMAYKENNGDFLISITDTTKVNLSDNDYN
jgi:DNA polymerase II small subunit/DNA polymerase delta subunit B